MEPALLESAVDSFADQELAAGGAEILLVEDHEDTARVLHRMLEKSGYGVKTAHSVSQRRDRSIWW